MDSLQVFVSGTECKGGWKHVTEANVRHDVRLSTLGPVSISGCIGNLRLILSISVLMGAKVEVIPVASKSKVNSKLAKDPLL